jgi:2,5-diketo-D-gluconate reductase B
MDTGAIPKLGLGTYGSSGSIGLQAMIDALELGYRHIDTAQSYRNESDVGAAIDASGIDRREIFVTTKVGRDNLAGERVIPSLRESLERLRLDQADLTLIHWPGPDGAALPVYMEALARAKAEGLTRMIGVSNFTNRLLDAAIAVVGDGEIATNQVEVHPFHQNAAVRRHCASRGVVVTAYMPVAGGQVAEDATIRSIAERLDATPAQATLAWLMQEGMVAIPSSRRRAHLEANLGALDLRLPDADMAAFRSLDRRGRIIDPPIAPDWD